MRDQVEIEFSVPLHLNKRGVYDCSRAWVHHFSTLLMEKSVLDVSIDEAVDDFGLVPWGGLFEKGSNCLYLFVLDLLCKGRSPHAVSIDDNLLREGTVCLMIRTHGVVHESFEDLSPLLSDSILLDVLQARTLELPPLFWVNDRWLLFIEFGEALCVSLR
jgi:hypothetical protein